MPRWYILHTALIVYQFLVLQFQGLTVRYYSNLGTRWRHIGGKLKQIEASANGAIWGVNRGNNIYYRAGVTRRNPAGRKWIHVRGRLTHITVGCPGVLGLSRYGHIWRYNGTAPCLICDKMAMAASCFKQTVKV